MQMSDSVGHPSDARLAAPRVGTRRSSVSAMPFSTTRLAACPSQFFFDSIVSLPRRAVLWGLCRSGAQV
jgi:hypothetical protein